jgi:hypothetical protein
MSDAKAASPSNTRYYGGNAPHPDDLKQALMKQANSDTNTSLRELFILKSDEGFEASRVSLAGGQNNMGEYEPIGTVHGRSRVQLRWEIVEGDVCCIYPKREMLEAVNRQTGANHTQIKLI